MGIDSDSPSMEYDLDELKIKKMNNLIHTLEVALEAQKSLDLEIEAMQAIQKAPNEALGYYALAEANWIKNDWQKAEICLAKAIELAPNNASYLLRLAQWKEEQLEYDKAKICYLKALDIDTQQVPALKGLAQYYLQHSTQYERAAELLEIALALQQEDTELLLSYAQALIEIGREDKALEALSKCLTSAPSEAALILKINAHLALEEPAAVKKTYTQLIELSNAPQYGIRFANYLLNEADYAAAAQQLRALLANEQLEDKQPLRGLLGFALIGQEQYAEAIAIFDQMAQIDDKDSEIFVQRAKAKTKLQNLKGAIADYKIALSKVAEQNQPTIEIELAQLLLQTKDYPAATAIFKKLADHPLYEAEGYYGLGLALHQQGDSKGAFSALQKAQKMKHAATKVYLHEHFGEQLVIRAAKTMEKLAVEIKKNNQSKLLRSLFGRCFVFDSRRNKMDAKLPKEVQQKLEAALIHTLFIITTRGLILLNPIENRALRAAYRITDEEEDEVELQLFPLDGSPSFELTLGLNGNHIELEPQLRKAKTMTLQPKKWAKLGTQQLQVLKQHLKAEDVQFLGDAAAELTTLL